MEWTTSIGLWPEWLSKIGYSRDLQIAWVRTSSCPYIRCSRRLAPGRDLNSYPIYLSERSLVLLISPEDNRNQRAVISVNKAANRRRFSLYVDEIVSHRVFEKLILGVKLELTHDSLVVRLDGVGPQPQPFSYILKRKSVGQQFYYFQLPSAK